MRFEQFGGRGRHGRFGPDMMMREHGRERRAGPWELEEPGGGHRRGGRRGHRGGRFFAGGELRLVLLKLIADESRHGYELIKAVEDLTGGRYVPSPGVVYPTLNLLVDEGAIEELAEGAPRKVFAATDKGRRELSERAEQVEQLFARLAAFGREGQRRQAPPITRAIGNLMAALHDRTAAELDRDTIHRIADVLDDAAKRIERL